MAMTVSCVVGTVLMFLEFGVLACSAQGSRRRSWFYTRLICASLVMLALAVGLAFAMRFSALPQRAFGLVWVALLLAALAAAPVFCYHAFARFPGSPGGDGTGGPGSGPPPPAPGPPRGGAPLADAEQARERRRDHDRSSPGDVRRRRPAAEPVRRAYRPAQVPGSRFGWPLEASVSRTHRRPRRVSAHRGSGDHARFLGLVQDWREACASAGGCLERPKVIAKMLRAVHPNGGAAGCIARASHRGWDSSRFTVCAPLPLFSRTTHERVALGRRPEERLIAARATDERPRLSCGRSCPTLCRPQAS